MNGNSFLRNSAYSYGAVFLSGSKVVANCNTFEGNQAKEPTFYYSAIAGDKSVGAADLNFGTGGGDFLSGGGAICLRFSSLDAKLNVFTNNTGSSGGALYAENSHVDAKFNSFTFNIASNGGGGAIYGLYAVTVINADTFANNSDTVSSLGSSNLVGMRLLLSSKKDFAQLIPYLYLL